MITRKINNDLSKEDNSLYDLSVNELQVAYDNSVIKTDTALAIGKWDGSTREKRGVAVEAMTAGLLGKVLADKTGKTVDIYDFQPNKDGKMEIKKEPYKTPEKELIRGFSKETGNEPAPDSYTGVTARTLAKTELKTSEDARQIADAGKFSLDKAGKSVSKFVGQTIPGVGLLNNLSTKVTKKSVEEKGIADATSNLIPGTGLLNNLSTKAAKKSVEEKGIAGVANDLTPGVGAVNNLVSGKGITSRMGGTNVSGKKFGDINDPTQSLSKKMEDVRYNEGINPSEKTVNRREGVAAVVDYIEGNSGKDDGGFEF